MLVKIFVTVFVAIILSVVFFTARKKRGIKLKFQAKVLARIGDDVEKEIAVGLPLMGIGSDKNSDPEVSKAIDMIDLPSNVRIQLYE